MFCPTCGRELPDTYTYCPNCGQTLNHQSQPQYDMPPLHVNPPKPRGFVLSILALIFGALGGWLGLVLGIIALAVNKSGDPGVRKRATLGIILFAIWMVILVVLLAISAAA